LGVNSFEQGTFPTRKEETRSAKRRRRTNRVSGGNLRPLAKKNQGR